MPRDPLERLEPRRLFASIGLHGHVLTVVGNPSVATTITVGLSPDASSVVATVAFQTGTARRPVPHTLTKAYPLADTIKLVKINGGAKADTITIDQTYGSFPIPTQIHAGAGDDTVTCGDEPDKVWGQAGNDLIYGGAGNDDLFGQPGRDTLFGGAGDDFIAGGAGQDSMVGGDGNDTLNDPQGPDTVLGGAGNNTFNIHSLRNDAVNDYNDAKDKLHLISLTADDTSTTIGTLLGDLFPISFF